MLNSAQHARSAASGLDDVIDRSALEQAREGLGGRDIERSCSFKKFFVLLGSPSKKRGASCLGGRFSWGKNGAGEESRHKITLLPKVINRDRYNYKRTRYHLPSLNGRWPSDTQVDLVLDSGHIINQQRSPSHHLSQSFRPPSLAARQLHCLFVMSVS